MMMSSDNMTLGDAQEMYMNLEKKIILRSYNFPSKPSGGYYRIHVSDPTKKSGRTTLSAKTLDELKEKVYAFEKGIKGIARKTFAEAFVLSQEEKLKYIKDPEKRISVQNTLRRTMSEYNRFFRKTAFETKYMDTISKADVEDVIFMNLQRHNLHKKGLASLKAILNATFNLAYEHSWITDNVYKRVNFRKFDGMLAADVPIEDRVHSTFDMQRIMDYLHEYQQSHPKYIVPYALELQILMGLRRGEIPPLMWKDIRDSYIEISKEQLTVKRTESTPEQFVVVGHTKTWKARRFPRYREVDDLLRRLREAHERCHLSSPYLFPANNSNGIITNNTVYNFYRRMCKNLGIKVDRNVIKGTHSFRRNAITDVVNASGGNILMASQLFGNTPEVARKHYFTGQDQVEAAKVLGMRKLC